MANGPGKKLTASQKKFINDQIRKMAHAGQSISQIKAYRDAQVARLTGDTKGYEKQQDNYRRASAERERSNREAAARRKKEQADFKRRLTPKRKVIGKHADIDTHTGVTRYYNIYKNRK